MIFHPSIHTFCYFLQHLQERNPLALLRKHCCAWLNIYASLDDYKPGYVSFRNQNSSTMSIHEEYTLYFSRIENYTLPAM